MRSALTPVRALNFFALTYLLSWFIWIPLALSHFGIGPLKIPEGISTIVRLLGVLMPATAALLLTARAGGRAQLKRLLQRLTIWRVGWIPWAAVVVVQPALLVFTGWAYNALGGQPPLAAIALDSIAAFVVNIFFLLLATVGEEIGWRGVALPALQYKHRALGASIILGSLWAIWHMPFWLLLDTFDQYGFGYIALNLLFLLPGTLYITWFFNHSRSSLLLPIVFHVVFNIVNVAWLPVTVNPGAFAFLVLIEWVIAILLLPNLDAEPAPVTGPVRA